MLANQLSTMSRCCHGLLAFCPAPPARHLTGRAACTAAAHAACPSVAGTILVITLRVTQERLRDLLDALFGGLVG